MPLYWKGLGRWGWQVQGICGSCSVKIVSALSIPFPLPLPKKQIRESMGTKGKGKSICVLSMGFSSRSEIATESSLLDILCAPAPFHSLDNCIPFWWHGANLCVRMQWLLKVTVWVYPLVIHSLHGCIICVRPLHLNSDSALLFQDHSPLFRSVCPCSGNLPWSVSIQRF